MRFRTACGGFFFVPSVRILAWSSRAGPRAGPPTLRSAIARCRRRGSPRHAARASPLRSSAPWARLASPAPPPRPPWRWPPSLRYACVRRRRPGTARLAARTSPLRMSGPWARLGSLVSLSSFTAGAVVFAPPRLRAAPPPGPGPAPGSRPDHFASRTRRARIALTAPSAILHAALRARGRLGRRDAVDAPPAEGGRGRGRAPTRQAPCWPGTEGEESGAVPISLHPGCARCAAPSAIIFHPARDNRGRR